MTAQDKVTDINDAKNNTNLAIWDRVETTDPTYTKDFSGKGGFSGTSINPEYLAKKATEVFGPFGIGWGIKITREERVEGGPLFLPDNEGRIMSDQKAVIYEVDIELWYKHGDEKGTVPSTGNATFIGKNRYGIFTDEEAKKKAHTDARGKALSLLGFAGDVFLGLFDDPDYVEEIGREHEIDKAEDKQLEKEQQYNDHMKWFNDHIELLKSAVNENEVKVTAKGMLRKLETRSKNPDYKKLTQKQSREVTEVRDNRLEEIKKD